MKSSTRDILLKRKKHYHWFMIKLDIGYRLDIIVENSLVIEIKSVDTLSDIHTAQVLTYLKLSGNRLGLLINFNVTLLKNGIKRLVV